MSTWKPKGPRYIVRPHTSKEVTEGGIILPEESKQTHNYGTVLACGAAADSALVGNVVMYTSYAGVSFEERDPTSGKTEVFLLIDDEDIIATRGSNA